MYVQLCIHTFTLAQIHVYAGVCVCELPGSDNSHAASPSWRSVKHTHTTHTQHTHTHFIRSSTDCIYQILLQFCCCYSFLYSTIFKQLIAAQPAWTAQQQTRLQLFFIYPLYNKSCICVCSLRGVYVWLNLQEPRQNFFNCVTFCNVLHTYTYTHTETRIQPREQSLV